MFQIANGSWVDVTASATPRSDPPRRKSPIAIRFIEMYSGPIVATAGSIRTARTSSIMNSRPRNFIRENEYAARTPRPTLSTEMMTATVRLFRASWKKETGLRVGRARTRA